MGLWCPVRRGGTCSRVLSLRPRKFQDVVRGELRAVDGADYDSAASSGCFERKISYSDQALPDGLIDTHVL